jgi:voltage-gated potassium channel
MAKVNDDRLKPLFEDRADDRGLAPWRHRIHEIIFEADTSLGRAFDLVLIVAIILSVVAVMLDSVGSIHDRFAGPLLAVEWLFTVLFTIEYVLRLSCVRKPWRYALSFYGIVDLLAILPTYISIMFPGAQALLAIRSLRLMRVFRVFKLGRFLSESDAFRLAIWRSRAKLTVFLTFVTFVVVIMGTAMHVIEGNLPGTPYRSIPESVYWAIITMTTVGFGDITPQTALGKALTAVTVLIGYSMIIVPTSIVTAETLRGHGPVTTQACEACGKDDHAFDAHFCKYCGAKL